MIDWHKILVAYISHVNACEGTDYVEWYGVGGTAIETELTDAERAEWHNAGQEAREFDRRCVASYKAYLTKRGY